jgi:hypothetical protein
MTSPIVASAVDEGGRGGRCHDLDELPVAPMLSQLRHSICGSRAKGGARRAVAGHDFQGLSGVGSFGAKLLPDHLHFF